MFDQEPVYRIGDLLVLADEEVVRALIRGR
jgi:hypothetical protein